MDATFNIPHAPRAFGGTICEWPRVQQLITRQIIISFLLMTDDAAFGPRFVFPPWFSCLCSHFFCLFSMISLLFSHGSCTQRLSKEHTDISQSLLYYKSLKSPPPLTSWLLLEHRQVLLVTLPAEGFRPPLRGLDLVVVELVAELVGGRSVGAACEAERDRRQLALPCGASCSCPGHGSCCDLPVSLRLCLDAVAAGAGPGACARARDGGGSGSGGSWRTTRSPGRCVPRRH
ncbi:hypothetical protein M432DRAFT_11312 [Thermoascus aurantiacus ATCC 26904]